MWILLVCDSKQFCNYLQLLGRTHRIFSTHSSWYLMLKTENTVRNKLHQDICGNTILLLPLLIDPEFTALSDKFTAHSSAPVEFLRHAVIRFVPAVETMQRKHFLLTLAPPTDLCSVQSKT